MGARDQVGVADIAQRAFEGARDAHPGQRIGHRLRPHAAAATYLGQAGAQRFVVGIEAEAEDMHGLAGEGDRDFGAGEVLHAQAQRGVARALLAAGFVMVGQRPEFNPAGVGALGQGFGGQGAVGNVGVRMQIGVEEMHNPILRTGPTVYTARDSSESRSLPTCA